MYLEQPQQILNLFTSNFDMKDLVRFVKYVICVFIMSITIIAITFVGIVAFPQNKLSTGYNSVVQTKYDNLINTKSPKIIIIGGSSAAFGINEDILEEATGLPVVNLGVHVAMGGLFNTEISKGNIKSGDIVLLGYEYQWGQHDYFHDIGVEQVMSGIDSRIDMYQYIPINKWDQIMGYLFTFASKKLRFEPPTGTYTRASFNEDGAMILKRDNFVIDDYQHKIDTYGNVTGEKLVISQESKEYLKKYKSYVENRGASVYFIAPPLLDEAYQDSLDKLTQMVNNEEEQIGIPYISNPIDYLFSSDFMFDTIYHCNSKGEEHRTQLLIDDLKVVLMRN